MTGSTGSAGTPGNAPVGGLQVSGLRVVLDGATVLRGADLQVGPGEIAVVLGPSGCGKSTLLRAVAGLERPVAGSIRCDGEEITAVPVHRRGVALMFQDGQLFGHLSVARNVEYALRRQRVPRAERTARVAELLELVGLGGFGGRLPGTLSGGERQRVALARALAARPRLLLLDEPLSALDAGLRERLATDLRRILRAAGTTTVLVTHDRAEAVALGDRVAVMRDGVVVQADTPTRLWRAPVDAETARFLGQTVLRGSAADAVLAAAGTGAGQIGSGQIGSGQVGSGEVALRRGALVVDPSGPLAGVVRERHATPDGVAMEVEVAGVGVLPALAESEDAEPGCAPGDTVRVRVVASRVARLPATR